MEGDFVFGAFLGMVAMLIICGVFCAGAFTPDLQKTSHIAGRCDALCEVQGFEQSVVSGECLCYNLVPER